MTFLKVLAFFLALASVTHAAVGAEPATLDRSSKAAYDASIVAMAEGQDPTFARRLILAVVKLASASAFPDLQPAQAMAKLAADEEAFLAALSPYEGLDAEQLLAAAAK